MLRQLNRLANRRRDKGAERIFMVVPHRNSKKLEKFSSELLRSLLLAKVSAIQNPCRPGADGLRSPGGEHVPHGSDPSSSAPQYMKRAFDPFAGGFVSFVHFQGDVRTGAEIFAGRMDRSWIGEYANILLHLVRGYGSRCLVQTSEYFLQVELRIEPDHMFRKRISLNEKEPPHVSGSEFLVRSFIHCERGRDIHKACLLDALGITVQQQQWPTGPLSQNVNGRSACIERLRRKSRETRLRPDSWLV